MNYFCKPSHSLMLLMSYADLLSSLSRLKWRPAPTGESSGLIFLIIAAETSRGTVGCEAAGDRQITLLLPLLDYPPRSIKIARSATSRAKLISCVTITIVRFSCASWRIVFRTSPTSSGSSADVGSSNKITSGRIASARAIATRCC